MDGFYGFPSNSYMTMIPWWWSDFLFIHLRDPKTSVISQCMNLSASKKRLFFFSPKQRDLRFPQRFEWWNICSLWINGFSHLDDAFKANQHSWAEESHQLAGNGQKEPCHYASVGAWRLKMRVPLEIKGCLTRWHLLPSKCGGSGNRQENRIIEKKPTFCDYKFVAGFCRCFFFGWFFFLLAGSRMPLPNDLSTKFCFHRSVGKEGRSLLHSGFPRDSLRNSKEIWWFRLFPFWLEKRLRHDLR